MSRSVFGSLDPGGQQIAQRLAFAFLELSPAQLGEAMLHTHDILKDTPGWPPEAGMRVLAAMLELLGCPELDLDSPISEDELAQIQAAMERAFAMIRALAQAPVSALAVLARPASVTGTGKESLTFVRPQSGSDGHSVPGDGLDLSCAGLSALR